MQNMIKNLLPALLLDSSGPCISEMDDHPKNGSSPPKGA
jgi:hypothetical protein